MALGLPAALPPSSWPDPCRSFFRPAAIERAMIGEQTWFWTAATIAPAIGMTR